MPKFVYKIKYEDIESTNEISAENLSIAIEQIKQNGYELISIEEKKKFLANLFFK